MKQKLSILSLSIFLISILPAPLTWANKSYIDDLFSGQEEEITCDNVLENLDSFLTLTEKNQTLLLIFARRILSALSNSEDNKNLENLEKELAESIFLIEENQFTLSDQSFFILEVLPNCLKESSKNSD